MLNIQSNTERYCPSHAAHDLLRDVLRDSDRVVQGPPGPPGPPGIHGQSQWVNSRENVAGLVEHLKCKSMSSVITNPDRTSVTDLVEST